MTKKISFLSSVDCPYCQKTIELKKEVEIITPAEPAEKVVSYKAEKSNQTKLPTE